MIGIQPQNHFYLNSFMIKFNNNHNIGNSLMNAKYIHIDDYFYSMYCNHFQLKCKKLIHDWNSTIKSTKSIFP